MTGDTPRRIVVVGGGLAGARTCEQLRHRGFEGELTLVAAEPHLPYDRPPLPVDLAGLGVHVRLDTAATGLDVDERVLHTFTTETVGGATADSAGRLGFDALAIATGATPISVAGPGEQLTVRTLDDALRLRARLTPGARVVVIGASWIGAEVASSALALGCRVTCVEAGPGPVARALGTEVAKRVAPWWSGVDLRTDVAVDHVATGAVVLRDQRIHVDLARAKQTPFGGTIAHGYLTLALAGTRVGDLLQVDGASSIINYGLDKARFPAPLPSGTRVRTHAAITGVTEVAGGLQVAARVTAEAEGVERPVCVADVQIRYLR